ncbi:MAG: DUF4830 domain-containing protein [Ruminococcaceae bacterium]|nr:DUF4830 domain-containing protein [Oscillospiraceae bacterium]
MFIYSLRASTIKFFAVICVALVALITLIAFVPDYGDSVVDQTVSKDASISYDKIKTNEDRIEFLSQFGWEVKAEAVTASEVTIPNEFDKVFTGYNEIQKRQGLDLSKYKKKNVMRYTYEITNYNGYDGTVYANLIIYRNRVIGGDICSADVTGFIHGFEK